MDEKEKTEWREMFNKIIEESEKTKTYTISAYLSGILTMDVDAKNKWEAEQEVGNMLRSLAKVLGLFDAKIRIDEYFEEGDKVIE